MSTQVYTTRQVATVNVTTNYKQFKLLPTNRPKNSDYLMRLYDEIERKNLLAEYPILVDQQMRVIDGQHRLEIAESMGLPIHYIVSDRISIEDVATTNAHTRRWSVTDYLAYWCGQGNTEYLTLRAFWNKYPFLPIKAATNLCHLGPYPSLDAGASKDPYSHFRAGRYTCNNVAFAMIVSDAVIDFRQYVSFYNQVAFVKAIANLMAHQNYDHRRMMNRMKRLSSRLRKCASLKDYLPIIENIYNHGSHDSVRFRYLNPDSQEYLVGIASRISDHPQTGMEI